MHISFGLQALQNQPTFLQEFLVDLWAVSARVHELQFTSGLTHDGLCSWIVQILRRRDAYVLHCVDVKLNFKSKALARAAGCSSSRGLLRASAELCSFTRRGCGECVSMSKGGVSRAQTNPQRPFPETTAHNKHTQTPCPGNAAGVTEIHGYLAVESPCGLSGVFSESYSL